MRFVFWNVGVRPPGKGQSGVLDEPTRDWIERLAGRLTPTPDVFTLIEGGDVDACQADVRERLRARTGRPYYYHPTHVRGMGHFVARSGGRFQPLATPPHGRTCRYDVRWVRGAAGESLLVSVHAPSKLHGADHDQELFLGQLARHAAQLAGRMKLPVVLYGDFNADPYEPAMAGVQYLHGVRSVDLLRRATDRTVYGQGNPPLYNPLWAGNDGGSRPPGTYFHNPGRAYQLYWHLFDQVLVSRSIVDPVNRLRRTRILPATGGAAGGDDYAARLLAGGRPDHLPVLFDLDL